MSHSAGVAHFFSLFEKVVMKLELRDVSKRIGADIHIHETSLVLESGAFNVLLGGYECRKNYANETDGGFGHSDLRSGSV